MSLYKYAPLKFLAIGAKRRYYNTKETHTLSSETKQTKLATPTCGCAAFETPVFAAVIKVVFILSSSAFASSVMHSTVR
jgi:hypothetical protein